MKTTLAVTVAALALLGTSAQAQTPKQTPVPNTIKLVPAGSEIIFTSKQMGVPVDGHFKRFDAQLSFDPKKPETGKVSLSVDLGSVSMGAPEVEAELVKPAWFDSKKIASATFVSSTITSSQAKQLQASGKLTIKGIGRDLVVPVTLAQAGPFTTASGVFVIKRLDYKIGDGEWNDPSLVANDVQVKFKLAFNGVAPL